jgi:hypothetical protein
VEANSTGGQGSSRAVAPGGGDDHDDDVATYDAESVCVCVLIFRRQMSGHIILIPGLCYGVCITSSAPVLKQPYHHKTVKLKSGLNVILEVLDIDILINCRPF